jgi:hypothetical protein
MKAIMNILAVVVLLLGVTSLQAQDLMSYDGLYNLSELHRQADSAYQMSGEDAVLLLDKHHITRYDDGRIETYVHGAIWIRENVAIDNYGDHRIPYDSERTEFTVNTLRTYRDNQWWETGETGIVETLPYALRNAYDYTNIREMLLLHNGIELPCLLEVAYTITDKEPFRPGYDYRWMFQKHDPAVRSEFGVTLPESDTLISYAFDVDGKYQISYQEDGSTYTWTLGPLPALPYPTPDYVALFTPYVEWGTWESWEELASDVKAAFRNSISFSEETSSDLDSIMRWSVEHADYLERIGKYLSENTRFTDYDMSFFMWHPRTPQRVLETGYANIIDRLRVIAAVFENDNRMEAPEDYRGFVLYGHGSGRGSVPGVSWVDAIRYSSGWEDQLAIDPSACIVTRDTRESIADQWTHVLLLDDTPELETTLNPLAGVRNDVSAYSVIANVGLGESDSVLVGSGSLTTTNGLSVFDQIAGYLDVPSKRFIEAEIGSIFNGVQITDYSVEAVGPDKVKIGYEFKISLTAPDEFDRYQITLKSAKSGLNSVLRPNVSAYQQELDVPVFIPCEYSEAVTIRIDPDGLDLVYVPEFDTIMTSAGGQLIHVIQDSSYVQVMKRTRIYQNTVEPPNWSELRPLLLEHEARRNSVIYFKLASNEEDED